MTNNVVILVIEALAVYGLVLGAHSLRTRFGLAHFYALIGGLTAVMSWVTDAGVAVNVAGITFMVGSTVFYTSLLLGVFVVYVFDGPRATRIAISTIVGVSIMVPLIALALHFQVRISGHEPLGYVPMPSARINTASVLATLVDLVFLAMAWEFLGQQKDKIHLFFRSFVTLLGVMWLDVLLFATGAFAGSEGYLAIMQGTLTSRFVVSVFAAPLLWAYIHWQSRVRGMEVENRPVLAILMQIAEIRRELTQAQEEIARRKQAETRLAHLEARYRKILETANEALVVVQEGRVRFFNRAALELFGLARQGDLMMRLIRDFIHPGDKEAYAACHLDRLQGRESETPHAFRVVGRDGSVRWLQASEVPLEWDGQPATLSFLSDITQRKKNEERLHELAVTDSLTRLMNRRHFLDLGRRLFTGAATSDRPLTLLMADVDHFKRINDTHGHETGDRALMRLAALLAGETRDADLVCRWGGEEFAVLLPDTGFEEGFETAERLRRALHATWVEGPRGRVRMTLSIGVAGLGPGVGSLEVLLKKADEALYLAKRQGRDRVAGTPPEPAQG